ncbi:peptidylprolyl isomerase [Flavivirga amylovorans]|uniref:Peptidylprolyl isomerase n=1 Tax=Flavivirga amylovorans TaxID=870486 RepID=A0ABT8WYP9_9FLAO|nr:peptidylprolyl isomerase [Flavivirga amylovorans]MDO5986499.1 peptidylprolyl isomerase [Flavivirga amylovorans]
MLLKTNNLKFTINLKHISVLFMTLLAVNVISAQEIIEEEVKEEAKEEVVKKVDSTLSKNAIKVDGVAAVVGDYIILDSDVPREREQIIASGGSVEGVTDCQLLGKLLENKLYAHHAIQDSIQVSDAEIRQEVDYTIQNFLQQKPDINELVKFYKQEDEKGLRDYIFEIIKGNKLSGRMQAKIVEEVEITPEEVRAFFNKIPEDERPFFGTELKVAQIVAKPKVSEEEKQKVIDRLKQFKVDVVENGASFRSKVVLYGEDPGMKQSGYIYTLNRKKPKMVKEFRQVAFSLQEGEVSDPFETEFGYHIIHCVKIRGQEYDVSHVLLFPKVSIEAVKEAKERLEKVRQRIIDGDITFADAARETSDEKETRGDGGQLINPRTQDYNFDLTKMGPEQYAQIQNLKDNEVSQVLTEQDRKGNLSYKIMKVTDRIDEHKASYARDYLKIKELALDEKKIKAIETWQEEKILDTYIKISGKFRDCEFSGNWLKK